MSNYKDLFYYSIDKKYQKVPYMSEIRRKKPFSCLFNSIIFDIIKLKKRVQI